jgi:hypothetical protein
LLLLAAPIGVIVGSIAGDDGIVPRAEGDFVGPVLMVWLLVTFMLGFAQVGLRADQLKTSLPLPARTVWLARLTSIFVFVLVAIAVTVVFMVAYNDRRHHTPVPGDAIAFLAALFGVAVLGVAVIQNFWPTLREIKAGPRAVLYTIAVWAVCLTMLFILLSADPVWSVVPFAAAAALLVRAWRRLPAAFSSVGGEERNHNTPPNHTRYTGGASTTEAALAAASAVQPAELTPARYRRLTTKTILLTLYRPVAVTVIVSAMLVFLGFYVSGFYPEPLSGPIYMFWIFGVAPAFIIWPARNVYRLDHLPLSRRRLFPYLGLYTIGLICLGFIGGTVGGNTLTPREPLREYLGTRECPFYTRVPDRFLNVAWDGNPPAITAPWGESHEPWECCPIKGRDAVMYSPYSIPAGSSREFVAWQISREMGAIYGLQVAPEQISARFDRYFEKHDDGIWALRTWGDPLRADFPKLRLRDWARPMAASVLFLGITWFLTVAWIIWAFFRGVSPTFFALLGRFLPPAVPICFIALLIWLGDYGYTSSWKLTAMANILIRRFADLLPANPVALWGVVVVVLAAFYFLAETAFRRAQLSAAGKID